MEELQRSLKESQDEFAWVAGLREESESLRNGAFYSTLNDLGSFVFSTKSEYGAANLAAIKRPSECPLYGRAIAAATTLEEEDSLSTKSGRSAYSGNSLSNGTTLSGETKKGCEKIETYCCRRIRAPFRTNCAYATIFYKLLKLLRSSDRGCGGSDV